jgi:hypothetical protein
LLPQQDGNTLEQIRDIDQAFSFGLRALRALLSPPPEGKDRNFGGPKVTLKGNSRNALIQ